MKLPYQAPKAPKLILTPFLDVFTTLLAFLLISFAPKEANVKRSSQVILPDAAQKIQQRMPNIQVEVAADIIHVNGRPLDGVNPSVADTAQWEKLKTRIQELAHGKENEPILIIADKHTEFQFVDRLAARLAALGHSSIFFLTKTKPNGVMTEVASKENKL